MPYPHDASNCSSTGPQHSHPAPFQGAINHLVVLRRNVLESNGGIAVRGHTTDVLVVDNVIKNSDVGVHVNTTHASHVLVTGNTVPTNAADPKQECARPLE